MLRFFQDFSFKLRILAMSGGPDAGLFQIHKGIMIAEKTIIKHHHHGQIEPDAADMQHARHLRLQRFGIAFLTYVMVTLTAFLTTQLGLGQISPMLWVMVIGVGIFNNLLFFFLLYSGISLRFADPSLTWIQILFSGMWGIILLHALPGIRPVVLMFYVPAFCFGMLRLSRRQYMNAVCCVMALYGGLLSIEYLRERPGFDPEYEIFVFVMFGILLTWFALFGGFISTLRQRLRHQNREVRKAHQKIQSEVEQRIKAQDAQQKLIEELKHALAEVKTLSGLLPICASCKKIRDDSGYWNQIESYITHHSKAKFSHGICPDCARKLYPDYFNPEFENPEDKSEKH